MYGIDINFLKDRGLNVEFSKTTVTKTQTEKKPIAGKIPIVIGGVALVLLPGAAFGYLKSLESQKATIEEQIQAIDAEIADLGSKNEQIQQLKDQLATAEQETQALVDVFNRIKPWSAILEDLRDRIPPGVQISSLQQNGSDTNIQLSISGVASSYEDVNDFVLLLQRSPFTVAQKTKLNSTSVGNFDLEIENQDEIPENIEYSLPSGIRYSITTVLNDIPASELIQELNNNGAYGLVTRLKILEQKGAI